ncbi:hypothetical protein [Nocardioides sp.]|uniref:hypothetical protein n=1 Tax=Nocardioides sp. TaxID=35761 RepID=UPI003527861B
MDTTTCPACGTIAEILWRDVLDGTDGPVEHAKIQCLARHWFLLPVASLTSRARNSGAARPAAGATPL